MLLRSAGLLLFVALSAPLADAQTPLAPVVEVEDEVYRFEGANNGAGPMWCSGSTCLVRVQDRVFASGLETLPQFPPLNNCRWQLFERAENRLAAAAERRGRPHSRALSLGRVSRTGRCGCRPIRP